MAMRTAMLRRTWKVVRMEAAQRNIESIGWRNVTGKSTKQWYRKWKRQGKG
jgi:hypothetical protein